MRNLSRRKKNNIIIASLCAIVVLMGIGYAAFASQLKINGTSSISSNFSVLITDITSGSIVGGASNAAEPAHTATTATFNTNLVSPGDSITYTIKVENQGTIDAILTSIDVNTGSNEAIEFVTSGIEEGDNLLQGESDELYVKVTYSNSITSQPENTTSNITVTLNYEQATGGTIPGGDTANIGGQDVEVVTTGDGLYEDGYEAGKYTYKGANPNNYIEFDNGELWRIIAKEADGTYKIIRNDVLPNQAWDTNNSNDWEMATLNTYLNGEYLQTLSDSDKVLSHSWNIGSTTYNDNLEGQINDEQAKKWNGKVGLITVSEYLRANTNEVQCSTLNLNNDNYAICTSTNWLRISSGYMWTITATTASTQTGVFHIPANGIVLGRNVSYTNDVPRPIIYLNSNITLTGSGTQSDPYVIV